jgi:hypothetical protein
LAVDFLAVDFFAGAFLAVLLLALDFLAGAFLAADERDVLDLLAEVFLAEPELDPDDFFAGAFLAELDFDAVEELLLFLAGDDFFAVDFDGLDFLAVDFAALLFAALLEAADFVVLDDFFAALPEERPAAFLADPAAFFADPVAFFAESVAFCATAVAACPAEVFFAASAALRADSIERCAAGSLSSFLAPETIAFRSAPGVNFGTAFFFARIVSPVRGLRTVRALRTCLLNDPNPVMATFSPLATSRVMTSSTDSSACWACFRLPSKRAASVSTSSDLFTGIPFVNARWPNSALGACWAR